MSNVKIRIYEKNQLDFFPLYSNGIDINFIQPKVVRPDGFEYHQIFLVDSGNGILNVGNKTYHLCKNDLFYLSANTPHEYHGIDQNFKTSYLSFYGEGFKKICNYYHLKGYHVYKNKNYGVIKTALERLFIAFDTIYETSALCAKTFSTVITYFDEAYKKEFSPMEKVYNYIEANHSKPITLDDILTIYPYSKTKLCRDFKTNYHVTVFQMLTEIRLRHANHMINANPNIKLKDIAESCGFRDVSYFCKMYKRVYKHSPKTSENIYDDRV